MSVNLRRRLIALLLGLGDALQTHGAGLVLIRKHAQDIGFAQISPEAPLYQVRSYVMYYFRVCSRGLAPVHRRTLMVYCMITIIKQEKIHPHKVA